MPEPRKSTTKEVQKKLFECFSPSSMSDDDGESWEETGAFPTSGSSKDHIFTDEPFEGSYYASLEIVKEGSRETATGNSDPSHASQEELMAVSTTSSETPAIDNTADNSLRRVKMVQQQATHVAIKQSSSGSSAGIYPFNIYQSLSKFDHRNRDPESGVPRENNSSANATSISASTRSSSNANKKNDIEERSMPSPVTPMSGGEESSVLSDQPSQLMEAGSVQAPYSVISARSRRQSKRFMVRRTLPTSQQVDAHPDTMLKNLFVAIEQERHIHKLSGQHFLAVHNWVLFLPAILLTFVSGVGVLIFEADLGVSDDVRIYASIIIGVLAVLSVFWQALSKILDLGTRGKIHNVTSVALKRLSEDILLTLSSTDTIPAEYVALIGEKFAQAMDACPSTVPYKLESAFTAVSDRMALILKPPIGQPPRKTLYRIDFMRLYATAYDELTTEIIHHWTWPLGLPQPRVASDTALRNFKAIVTEGREAVPRKQCSLFCCPCCMGETPAERSLFDVIPVTNSTMGSPNSQTNQNYVRSVMMGQEV